MINRNKGLPFFGMQQESIGGPTKRNAIWKKNKATLWYYKSPKKQYSEPLFLIYSLVNQPFILDLYPGNSMIESFVNNGYDVYLLDFGIPGYEDKDITVDNYIIDYIQNAVRRCIKHANAKAVTIIGYCLGGTFAAVYAAIADEPIRNLILDVTPIDFSDLNQYDQLMSDFRNGDLQVDEIIDAYGVIPAFLMKAGVRMITSPVYYSRYLALLKKQEEKQQAPASTVVATSEMELLPVSFSKAYQGISQNMERETITVEASEELSPNVQGTRSITLDDCIAFLSTFQRNNQNDYAWKLENERLQRENVALKQKHDELLSKVVKLEKQQEAVQEDYQMLVQIMDRARKLTGFENEVM